MYSQSKDRTNRIIRCNDIACTANAYTKVSTVVTSKAKGTLCFRQQRHALLSTYRVPRQRRQNFNHKNYATGLWSEVEQHQFLTGLMQYGWGQWKEIGTIITTRYDTSSTISKYFIHAWVCSLPLSFSLPSLYHVIWIDRIVKLRVTAKSFQQSIMAAKIFWSLWWTLLAATSLMLLHVYPA